MDVETIPGRLGTGQSWEKRTDGWWLEDPELDVVSMARVMTGVGARLVTITARSVADGMHRLAYHWDLEGKVFTFITTTREGVVPSIVGFSSAADWIEREIHDYFAVNFTGREDLAPLLLHPDDPPGMFHWNSRKGEGNEL